MFIFVIDIFGWERNTYRIAPFSKTLCHKPPQLCVTPCVRKRTALHRKQILHEAGVCQGPEQFSYHAMLFSRLPQKAVSPCEVSPLFYIHSSQKHTT